MSAESPVVSNNEALHRYETELEGHTAFAEYFIADGVITFTHTLVPSELEGRGVGSALAKAALDDARARDLSVVPRCPFIRSYIERHGEYQTLVAESARDSA